MIVLRAVKKALWSIVVAFDWLLGVFSAGRRPQSMDDANARYGLDQLDQFGNRMGASGPLPGQSPRPRD